MPFVMENKVSIKLNFMLDRSGNGDIYFGQERI